MKNNFITYSSNKDCHLPRGAFEYGIHIHIPYYGGITYENLLELLAGRDTK